MNAATVDPAPRKTDPTSEFGLLLRDIREGVLQRVCRLLSAEGHDLGPGQFLVMKYLRRHGASSAGQIAKGVGYDPSAMTRLIDKLESAGYVRRDAVEGDRRATEISVTARGEPVAEAVERCGAQVIETAMDDLSEVEREQLFKLLRRVRAALGHHP